MANESMQLVLALFDNEAAADEAVSALQSWSVAPGGATLGGVGILVKDDKGNIKTHKLGKRDTGKGAGIGVVLGIIAAIMSGGLTLLGGLVGGAVLGAVVGAFVHKGLSMSPQTLAKLNDELNDGHAAVGVMVEQAQARATADQLARLGGKPETFAVSPDALETAAAATTAPADAATSAPPTAPPAAGTKTKS